MGVHRMQMATFNTAPCLPIQDGVERMHDGAMVRYQSISFEGDATLSGRGVREMPGVKDSEGVVSIPESTGPASRESEKHGITISLVIPTKDKMKHLSRSLPTMARLGFDEVIVVDSSKVERELVGAACKENGVTYHFCDTDRLGARNLGAKLSRSDWVAICDDDIVFESFDLDRFRELAAGLDFFFGGWGVKPKVHYAWIFRRAFFLETLRGYDRDITGGDDLDITLRAGELGRGADAFQLGLYKTVTIGLDIQKDYPQKWIRNKVLYSITLFPLLMRHKQLIPNVMTSDVWRVLRIAHGEPAGRVAFESFIDRAALAFSPVYYVMKRRSRKRCDDGL